MKYWRKYMKKRIGVLVLALSILMSGMSVQALEHKILSAGSKYVKFFFDELTGNSSEEGLSSLIESAEELMKDVKPEDAKKLIEFSKKQIQDGKWDTEKGIKEAIAEGEKEFGITLTEKQKEQILSVIAKVKKLGISPDYILAQAEKIYEKYGKELKEEAQNAGKELLQDAKEQVKEEVKKSFADYFTDMFYNVKTFFKGIFNK